MVVPVSSTTIHDKGSVPAPCSHQIEVTQVTCEKSVAKIDSTKHLRLSPGAPISSCRNIGPMRGGPCLTFRENNLAS